MSCPPLHINRLSLDSNGWAIQEVVGKTNVDDDVITIERPILPKCQRLLNAMQLSLSSDVFHPPTVGGDAEGDTVMVDSLDNLVHHTNIVDKIIAAIEEIRRLGTTTSRKRGSQASRRNGKVASLENQRRLRLQNEQKKLVQQAAMNTSQEDERESMEVQDEEEDEDEFEVPELRLAAVFNSIRAVIDIIRPMLDHPKSQYLGITMLNGPSIQKSGDKYRYYLFSKYVYSCASRNAWRRLKNSYTNLLEELEVGLITRMSKQVPGGGYALATKDWIASFFNHELYLNKDHVANKCMELSTLNPDVVSKLNAALIDQFDYNRDGKQRLLQSSINKLHQHLTQAISRRFNGARLTVYGSCLSGLALEGSHDVDISIYIPQVDRFKKEFDEGKMSADEYEKKMRKTIFNVRDILQNYRSEQFSNLFAVTRARVPVIKGSMNAQNPHTPDGSLSFDLCFLNEIAVVNSSLLKEYSLFDKNVRLLMLSVKSFAKLNGIASAADGTLSSYSWLNLVVFYLQCIDMVPALNCPKTMESHQLQHDPTNPWHSINGLQTVYLTKDMVTEKNIWQRSSHVIHTNPAILLYGFFNFYSAIFPQHTVAASIRFGEMSLQKTCLHQSSRLWRICVEDPFETCDSHCPHDLGCHVKEDGQKRINKCLVQAKKMLASVLQKEVVSDNDVSNLLSKLLWSISKNGSEKGSIGNQNTPGPNSSQSKARLPHDARSRMTQSQYGTSVSNAQNTRVVCTGQNEVIVQKAEDGLMIAPDTQNARIVHNTHDGRANSNAHHTTNAQNARNGKIVPNAQNRTRYGSNDSDAQLAQSGGKKPAAAEKYHLVVGNLSFNTTWQDLKDHFSQIGEVDRSDVARNIRGRSSGRGYIRYHAAKDAKRAINELNGVEFMGRPLDVKMGNKHFRR